MSGPDKNTQNGKDEILADLLKMIEERSSGWEICFEGSIGPDTLLGADLAYKSMDLIQLFVAIQKHYGKNDFPFQDLAMSDHREVTDLKISELADFLHEHLNR